MQPATPTSGGSNRPPQKPPETRRKRRNEGVIPTTPRKEKALTALLTCRTKAEAARLAGIAESTLREYMKDREFSERYRQACGDMLRDAAQQARQGISPALETLREITEAQANPQARIMAARSTLEYSLKLTERVDFLERLEALEKMQKEDTP